MRQKRFLAVVISFWIFMTFESQASTNRFSLLFLRPTQSPGDLMITPGSNNLYKNQWQFLTQMEYQHRPLELTRSNVVVGGISDKLFIQHLGASYAPTSWWQIDLDVPVVWYNKFTEPTIPPPTTSSTKTGLGDIFLRQRITLLRRSEHAVGFSINPFVTIPTGNENYFQADKRPTGGGSVTLDTELGKKVVLAFNTGMEVRQVVSFFDYTTSSRPFVSGGSSVKITEKWKVSGEGFAMTNIKKPFREKVSSPVEFLFGTKYQIGKKVEVHAGGAISIVRAAGVPLFRTMAGLSFITPEYIPPPKKVFYVGEEAPQMAYVTLTFKEAGEIKEVVIYFEPRTTEFPHETIVVLNQLVRGYEENTIVDLQVVVGSLTEEVYDLPLALKRAETVVAYLKERNVEAKTIKKFYVFFGYGEYQLAEISQSTLVKLAETLIQDQESNALIVIAGHTDDVGSESFNQVLSLKRAQFVTDTLIQHGLKPSQIKVEGYGELKPVKENITEEGRRINRRVDIQTQY